MRGMEQNLRIPGPTPIPDEVRDAQSAPMINHRGPEFAELLHEISDGIAGLIGASGDVFLLTGSGTGSLEAALVNTLSPGDRVLGVSIGGFGERFAKIAETFGAHVDRLDFEWGEAADPARLADALAGAPPYAVVLLTHNETSTGVANPLRELAAAVHAAPGEPLVLVDGISGLGAMPFEMDAWGVDLVVSASQKAFMASPGIAIAAVGARARAAEATARMPRYYWDFTRSPRHGREGPDAMDARGQRGRTACGWASRRSSARGRRGRGPAMRRSPPVPAPDSRRWGSDRWLPPRRDRRRSPRPGSPMAWTGAAWTPPCCDAGWSSPVGRGSGPGRSSASATWAT